MIDTKKGYKGTTQPNAFVDSFQESGSAAQNDSDFIDEDSDAEVPIPTSMRFQKQVQAPERTYATFEEADAAAEAERA